MREIPADLRALSRSMLGAVMCNPLREPWVTCEVCTGPVARYRRCHRCHQDAKQPKSVLAQRVIPLTYARVGGQAETDMYRYKDRMTPEQRRDNPSYQRLLMLVLGFSVAHSICLDAVAALPVTRLTAVLSLSGRPGTHPLAELAAFLPREWQRIELGATPVPASQRRETGSDHFVLADARDAAGQHVVVFDDTGVQGGHAQSAAATLRRAGAAEVSILVLARRIDPAYRAEVLGPALERMFAPREYRLEVCPITGGACPAS